jgi:alkylhydroperoxidase family enzyme
VVRDPNATTADDVRALREVGYDDAAILALTTFVALRLAFASVNDALAPSPDRRLYDRAPGPVREAVTFGRPVGP